MDDAISRQAAIDAVNNLTYPSSLVDVKRILVDLPSVQPNHNAEVSKMEIIRCKDCKHNPRKERFGCPMAHHSERQRPEDAWCWKGEREAE